MLLNRYIADLKTYPLLDAKTEISADRDTLITSNLRLVVAIAKHYVGRGMDLDDLVMEGNLGLIHAAEKYDSNKGRFSTYASYWIKQSINGALLNKVHVIHVPGYTRYLNKKLCLKPRQQHIIDQAHRFKRQNIEDDYVSHERNAIDIVEDVRGAMRGLPQRDRDILEMRYVDDMTMRTIGKQLGVTREYVRRLQTKSQEHIRRHLSGYAEDYRDVQGAK